MRLQEFDYHLPEELIAQQPIASRDQSRLMVIDKSNGRIENRQFSEIIECLQSGDLLVFNDTKVVAARLCGAKPTGGKAEVLLLRHLSPGVWHAMVKPGRRVGVGSRLDFDNGLSCDVVERTPDGGRILNFSADGDPDEVISKVGQVPLPPYIHKRLEDAGRYQTVYAAAEGSAAAPTAGLHFTESLIRRIKAKGVGTAFVTLHVGIATFRPVRTESIEDHEIHSEWFEVSEKCAEAINSASGRIVCVGTTTARALESAAVGDRRVEPMSGETRLYMTPGYKFKVVEALVTNFHVPKSTLLVLVSAFAGIQLVRQAYLEAVQQRYRFLSFGDAMFIF